MESYHETDPCRQDIPAHHGCSYLPVDLVLLLLLLQAE